jgi:hypothetical protein
MGLQMNFSRWGLVIFMILILIKKIHTFLYNANKIANKYEKNCDWIWKKKEGIHLKKLVVLQ